MFYFGKITRVEFEEKTGRTKLSVDNGRSHVFTIATESYDKACLAHGRTLWNEEVEIVTGTETDQITVF